MTNHRFSRHLVAHAVALLLVLSALPTDAAGLIPKAKVVGYWEISRVVVRKNATQAPPAGGYARLIGHQFMLEKNAMMSGRSENALAGEGGDGPLLLWSKKPEPMRILFEDEKIARPRYVRPPFNGVIADYPLRAAMGALADQPVTLYRYELPRMVPLDPGWGSFAAVGDIILMQHDQESLLILRRPPKVRAPEHAAFCARASSAIDRRICSDRQLWMRYHYIETNTPCALKQPARNNPQLADSLRALTATRNACDPGNLVCLVNALNEQSILVGNHIPATQMCVNGEYKDLPL
jgi:hypothetical protein